jgi:hypothetical protein
MPRIGQDVGRDQEVMMATMTKQLVLGDVVVITGARSALGQRVVRALSNDPHVFEVRTIDSAPVDDDESLASALAGATVLIHLMFVDDTEWRPRGSERDNVGGARRLLSLATEVDHVVGLSSALVYGAWPNNPAPLTEDAPLRPNPDFAYAVQRAQIEQLLADWVNERPDRTATVLRPCLTQLLVPVSARKTRPPNSSIWMTWHRPSISPAVSGLTGRTTSRPTAGCRVKRFGRLPVPDLACDCLRPSPDGWPNGSGSFSRAPFRPGSYRTHRPLG